MAGKRGFAAMDENQRRQIASKGGRAAHEGGSAHEWNEKEAAEAGRKGGEKVSRNREHMAKIGRKGGLASHHRAATNGASMPSEANRQPADAGAMNTSAPPEMASTETQPTESREYSQGSRNGPSPVSP